MQCANPPSILPLNILILIPVSNNHRLTPEPLLPPLEIHRLETHRLVIVSARCRSRRDIGQIDCSGGLLCDGGLVAKD